MINSIEVTSVYPGALGTSPSPKLNPIPGGVSPALADN